MSDTEDAALDLDAVFLEPPRPPSPEPSLATYSRTPPAWALSTDSGVWSQIEIRLVGSHPLWGHYLWNASRAFASYLDAHPEIYRNLRVLELGAGGGLPGLVTAKNGAKSVFLTDYPDAALVQNLEQNVQNNIHGDFATRVHVIGYIWGRALNPIFELQREKTNETKFDLIIMSDLIFNHSQHDALLQTAELALQPQIIRKEHKPCVLVFYSHHRPHLAYRDMQFFTKAKERGWLCEEILIEKFPPMFPEDSGDEEVRSTVHGWRLSRPCSTRVHVHGSVSTVTRP